MSIEGAHTELIGAMREYNKGQEETNKGKVSAENLRAELGALLLSLEALPALSSEAEKAPEDLAGADATAYTAFEFGHEHLVKAAGASSSGSLGAYTAIHLQEALQDSRKLVNSTSSGTEGDRAIRSLADEMRPLSSLLGELLARTRKAYELADKAETHFTSSGSKANALVELISEVPLDD